ncbi:uncharacterized protein LOC143187439 [Calliopsis andreniformis]|uniref:uncharacterized protein LOC143186581 n=1 Tax=Calliopsis andreniformis TaxID=337506 RepID=UPI003FCC7C28
MSVLVCPASDLRLHSLRYHDAQLAVYFASSSRSWALRIRAVTLSSLSTARQPNVGLRLSASTCFIAVPGRCSIEYSNSSSSNAQRATRTQRSFFRMVNANARQSVTILNGMPSK